jgi:hypothetical protein
VRHPRHHRCGDGAAGQGGDDPGRGAAGEDGALGQETLLLADRQFVDANLWRTAAATGARLLWRTRTNAVLPVLQTFPDGSYLSQIAAATDRRGGVAPTVVRVVEDTLGKDPGRPQGPPPSGC